MVRERRSAVAGAVVWDGPAERGERRVLPDGCMDLLWSDGELLVAGPDTHAHIAPAACTRTGIRFAPGTGPRVLGVPAHELRDRRVPLAALWSPAAVRALRAGRRVDRLAVELGISPRQLHRRALDGLGYGPKTLVRILRLQDAIELARAAAPYAETAARCGYPAQAR